MSAKNMTFVAALKDYFDMTASEVMKEFKFLSDEDKDDLKVMLGDEGYTIEAVS